ncbi:glycosyltransferase family 4 protein [Phaeodactylibacter luteus]|uniref:Glycosyltransferase family 4 protein n=1 Tax=Phaeodactylibacter luteus TaxID=1564516 RepID=A0A5C6RN08_9BACT|nr:glycosyltransferase family 1 protein [Phaeodactylibacter luteus]TXB63798.1 glycosyltransferase family 4 protein [Phaeodactylibacter luteus]
MKVHFDNQIFRSQKFGGISHYFAELFDFLPDYGIQPITQLSYTYNENYQRIGKEHWLERLTNGPYFKGRDRLKVYLRQKAQDTLNKKLSTGEVAVFHPTYYEDYYLEYLHPSTKLIVTVHDMTHELYIARQEGHGGFMEIRNKKKLLPRADKIIAISENTKRDILHLFPQIDTDKISVIHHGIRLPGELKVSKGEDSDHFLFVGNRSGYKNFNWLLENIADFLIQENLRLMCYGSGPFSQEEKNSLSNLGLRDLVLHQPFIAQEDLYHHYQGALGFLFPSVYEGFGYPILESWLNACPVILPRASCFPEIGGDAALFYEVDDRPSFVRCLEQLRNREERLHYVERGQNRVQQFSMDSCVHKHVHLYQSVLT